MGLPIFLILGILNLAYSQEGQDLSHRNVILDQTVTGVLGEEVYLRCLYTGKYDIIYSSWNRLDFSKSAKKMAGYRFGKGPFRKDNFDIPASLTNLTVKVNINSLDVEGEYTCVFNSDEDETKDTIFLSVIVRPDIDVNVKEEVVNGTLYQAVTCSASNAKPEPFISWEIAGALPRDDIFSMKMINATHPNGTTSLISILHFPLIMNNEKTVTCIVQHPTFTEPRRTDIEVNVFVSPVMTIERVLIQEGGEDFQEVICTATGGKPHPYITWMLPEFEDPPRLLRNVSNPDSVISSYRFPSDVYEGENITCVFGYTLLPFRNISTTTLPIYYLSSLQLRRNNLATKPGNQVLLALVEGDQNVTISMDVLGNVPSYKINCTKEREPLPEDVAVVGSDLFIKGPVEQHLAGQYHCQASYRKHSASLQLDIEVNPRVILPVTFPPHISTHLKKDSNHIYIECLAFNSSPAANVSWVIPEELNSTVQYDATSFNGSYFVRSVLTVPSCVTQKYISECIVEHPLITGSERRQFDLPMCAPPNITMQSSIKWENSIASVWLECRVESQNPAATITWATDHCNISSKELVTTQFEDLVITQSVTQIPIYLHANCTVTCVVEHQGLEKPKRESIRIPSLGPSRSRLFLGEEQYTHLWHAVCEYSGYGVKPNISWVLPDEETKVYPTTLQPTYNGINVQVNATYEFELSQYEGKKLICLIQKEHGKDEQRTIHVPKYSISSVEVLNKTTLDRRNQGQREYRLTLQENLSYQKIVLIAHGNAPMYNTQCYRENGSGAETVGMALVFTGPVSEQDSGLYICHVSYLHHMATVSIWVDVTSEETQHMIFITICFSSAAAITLILIVVLCVLCKQTGRSHPSNKKNRRERESLAALMQDPRPPEKTVLPGGKGPDYAELVRYSIVLDVKSTV